MQRLMSGQMLCTCDGSHISKADIRKPVETLVFSATRASAQLYYSSNINLERALFYGKRLKIFKLLFPLLAPNLPTSPARACIGHASGGPRRMGSSPPLPTPPSRRRIPHADNHILGQPIEGGMRRASEEPPGRLPRGARVHLVFQFSAGRWRNRRDIVACTVGTRIASDRGPWRF